MAGRVLVVDDEKMIVKGLKFSLIQDYSVVDCAYDGEEALEYVRNNEYDIILLDIMLPKLDGLSRLYTLPGLTASISSKSNSLAVRLISLPAI